MIRSSASRLWYRHPTVLWVTASVLVAAALTAIVFGLSMRRILPRWRCA